MAISATERAFMSRLGTRVAGLRKARSVTQVNLARSLRVSQQTVNSYEVGRRRIPVSAVPQLARLLGVTVEELLAVELPASKTARTRAQAALADRDYPATGAPIAKVRDAGNRYRPGPAQPLKEPSMNAKADQLIERLKALPPERRAEVEVFVDFLQSREGDRRLVEAAAKQMKSARRGRS